MPKRVQSLLFLPSTQQGQQIWSRLIEQLLENDGGNDSWRLLHDQWAPLLSPQVARELNVSTIDADGAWAALADGQVNLHELEFAADLWPSNDVHALMQGLFQAGQSRQQDPIASLAQTTSPYIARSHQTTEYRWLTTRGCLLRVSFWTSRTSSPGLPADSSGHLAEVFS